MLTEQSIIDSINVLEDGQIEVRRANIVLRDDVEITKTYHRYCLCPGDDVTGEDPRVASIAQAAWTPEVLTAWQAKSSSSAL
jgi:hypothetical protein